MTDLTDVASLEAAVRQAVADVTITDVHTHLFSPAHGDLLLCFGDFGLHIGLITGRFGHGLRGGQLVLHGVDGFRRRCRRSILRHHKAAGLSNFKLILQNKWNDAQYLMIRGPCYSQK